MLHGQMRLGSAESEDDDGGGCLGARLLEAHNVGPVAGDEILQLLGLWGLRRSLLAAPALPQCNLHFCLIAHADGKCHSGWHHFGLQQLYCCRFMELEA